jgi:photosystem II stability/assembly factor-like uncharacterized protein
MGSPWRSGLVSRNIAPVPATLNPFRGALHLQFFRVTAGTTAPIGVIAAPAHRGPLLLPMPRSCFALLALLIVAVPAHAHWERVLEVPETDIFTVFAIGDTLVAGADTVVYVSTDAGATWAQSVKVVTGVTAVNTVGFRNGRIYAGTYGQGVRVSDDLGQTWSAFNQGLVGGIANSQLYLKDLLFRGDSLYAATAGAGAWVRNLAIAGSWIHYGNAFEPNQSSNMNGLAAGGSRMLACAGFNGNLFFRDPGDPDWTLSWLDNVGIVPGLASLTAAWTGHGWVVGSNVGVFTSPLGEEPWTFVDLGLGTLFNVSFALRGRDIFADFGTGAGTAIQLSRDDGATWQELETLPFTFTYKLAIRGNDLYAGRFDGLWRRSIETVSVPETVAPSRLRFALAGAQPIGNTVRLRLELPVAGEITIEVFDVAGRRVAAPIRESRPAGQHEVAWNARGLGPGVYHARLTAAGEMAVVRMVRAW